MTTTQLLDRMILLRRLLDASDENMRQCRKTARASITGASTAIGALLLLVPIELSSYLTGTWMMLDTFNLVMMPLLLLAGVMNVRLLRSGRRRARRFIWQIMAAEADLHAMSFGSGAIDILTSANLERMYERFELDGVDGTDPAVVFASYHRMISTSSLRTAAILTISLQLMMASMPETCQPAGDNER